MTPDYEAAIERNVFEIDNARNQYERQLPSTFVATPIYWRLFSPKNQILVGTRGSGKTAILKMLTLPYLVNFDDENAKGIARSRAFLGIYVPITTLWLGPIKTNSFANPEEKGREFLWHLSIAACQAFTKTLESALESFYSDSVKRLEATAEIFDRLSRLWFPGYPAFTECSLRRLREELGRLPLEKNLFESSQFLDPFRDSSAKYSGGSRFYSPVLDALTYGMAEVEAVLGLESDRASWLICLDEIETLDEDCQVIINSFMRSDFGNRYFKIATLPYAHKTLRTALDAPLQVGNDFEYLWIDDNTTSQENQLRGAVGGYSSFSFARALYNKRRHAAGGAYGKHSLDRLLGKPSLLTPLELIREPGGASDRANLFHFDDLAKGHFNPKTIERASRLRHSVTEIDIAGSIYGDQLLRKTLGFLLLREAVRRKRGSAKSEVYFGAEMIVRLADGNARTLIRLLNSLWRHGARSQSRGNPVISRSRQSEIAVRFSRSIVDRVRSEEEFGQSLHVLLSRIGLGLSRNFHSGRIGSDFVGQIIFDTSQFGRFRNEIILGMQLGLLKVDLQSGTDFVLPTERGTFRLAYCLSPAFDLMPRRGRPSSFQSVVGSALIEQPDFNFGAPA